MRSKPGPFSIAAIVTFAISVCHAEAQPAARNLSGNYRCEPQPASCQTGQTFSVTQSGTNLERSRGQLGVAQQDLPREGHAGRLAAARQQLLAELDQAVGARRRQAAPLAGAVYEGAAALGNGLQQLAEKRGVHLSVPVRHRSPACLRHAHMRIGRSERESRGRHHRPAPLSAQAQQARLCSTRLSRPLGASSCRHPEGAGPVARQVPCFGFRSGLTAPSGSSATVLRPVPLRSRPRRAHVLAARDEPRVLPGSPALRSFLRP